MRGSGRTARNVIGCVLLVSALVSTLAVTGCLGREQSHVPAPSLTIVTWDVQRTVMGDGLFTVEVTNLGDAAGSKTIRCDVTTGNDGFSDSLLVTLAPGETRTCTITVDVPPEYFFTQLECSCCLV